MLEARQHRDNCFITLTYADEHLPTDRSLDKTHLQKFFKRLRKHRGSFRYYACGEYGDSTRRAHYHACLFGLDFNDKIELYTKGDHKLHTSAELDRIWGYGHCTVAELNFETAAYCARYVIKKQTGLAMKRRGPSVFGTARLDEETGELTPVIQPYAVMSLRSAIAKEWITKNHGDIYNAHKDFLVLRGKKLRPPKYFDRIFDTINPSRMRSIKEQREQKRKEEGEMTTAELRAHEKITRARLIQRKQV